MSAMAAQAEVQKSLSIFVLEGRNPTSGINQENKKPARAMILLI